MFGDYSDVQITESGVAPDADTKASEVESISDVLVSASGATPDSVICTSELFVKPKAGSAFSHCSSMTVVESSILNDLSRKQVQLLSVAHSH